MPLALDLIPPLQYLRRMRTVWLCRTYVLTRTDGEVMRFTDHDSELEIDGEPYIPSPGPAPSNVRRQGELENTDLEVLSFLSSDAITEEDLAAGLYRSAEIVVDEVDWRWPWIGPFERERYYIARTFWTGLGWRAELRGPSHVMDKTWGRSVHATCDVQRLGDARCGVNLAPFTEIGCVVAGTLDAQRRSVIRFTMASVTSQADGWYDHGEVQFTTGRNVDLWRPVRRYLDGNRDFHLQIPFPFPIEAGDVATIVAGCDRTAATCRAKFNNMANHRGEPFWPSDDQILKPGGR